MSDIEVGIAGNPAWTITGDTEEQFIIGCSPEFNDGVKLFQGAVAVFHFNGTAIKLNGRVQPGGEDLIMSVDNDQRRIRVFAELSDCGPYEGFKNLDPNVEHIFRVGIPAEYPDTSPRTDILSVFITPPPEVTEPDPKPEPDPKTETKTTTKAPPISTDPGVSTPTPTPTPTPGTTTNNDGAGSNAGTLGQDTTTSPLRDASGSLATNPPVPSQTKASSTTPIIVGVSVAAACLLLIAACAWFWLARRRRNRRLEDEAVAFDFPGMADTSSYPAAAGGAPSPFFLPAAGAGAAVAAAAGGKRRHHHHATPSPVTTATTTNGWNSDKQHQLFGEKLSPSASASAASSSQQLLASSRPTHSNTTRPSTPSSRHHARQMSSGYGSSLAGDTPHSPSASQVPPGQDGAVIELVTAMHQAGFTVHTLFDRLRAGGLPPPPPPIAAAAASSTGTVPSGPSETLPRYS